MSEQQASKWIPEGDQIAAELRLAVHAGDVEAIRRLLRDDPELATARLLGRRGGTSTPLHLVTDWPGYFPHGPQIVRLLIEAGADPNALTTSEGAQAGPGSETPLHYAASSDDADVAEALIDAGADIEAPDGSIGTPLDNAIGFRDVVWRRADGHTHPSRAHLADSDGLAFFGRGRAQQFGGNGLR